MSKRVDSVEDKVEDKEEVKSDLLVYPLMSPIRAYGEELKVIKMRRPRGMDLLAVGNPVIFSPHVDPPRIEHNLERVVAMVARLSEPAIPTPSLAELDPRDITGLAWAISPFFTPAR